MKYIYVFSHGRTINKADGGDIPEGFLHLYEDRTHKFIAIWKIKMK